MTLHKMIAIYVKVKIELFICKMYEKKNSFSKIKPFKINISKKKYDCNNR